MSKAVVIYNPAAGGTAQASEAIARLADRFDCELRLLDAAPELVGAVEQAADRGVGRILVAGGDGTIGHAVNALLPRFSDVQLGILPLGTANDLARSLDLPMGNLDLAFEIAATSPATAVDVVHVHNGESSYFVNAATGGFGGEVTAALTDTNKQIWGPFSYWMAAMAKLADLHAYDLDVDLDGEKSQLRIYGIGLANGRYAGGGFPIGGSAFLNDGLMDVIIIPELPTMELLGAGVNFIFGKHSSDAGVITKQARHVIVRTRPAMSFSFDGEPTKTLDASFKVVPRALQVAAGDNPALCNASIGMAEVAN